LPAVGGGHPDSRDPGDRRPLTGPVVGGSFRTMVRAVRETGPLTPKRAVCRKNGQATPEGDTQTSFPSLFYYRVLIGRV